MAPEINNLPRHIWEKNILPDMAARMGIKEGDYNPYKGLSFDEMEATMRTGLFTTKPLLNNEDWELLKNYILAMAPDTLEGIPEVTYHKLAGFQEKSIILDSIPGSGNITYMAYDRQENQLVYSNLRGHVNRYDWNNNTSENLASFSTPVVSYSWKNGKYALTIGQLSPTQVPTGQLFEKLDASYRPVAGYLHRPVHMLVEDLNKDGAEELIISEFGDLVGQLSIYVNKGDQEYDKRILLKQPGTIRVIARDMNNDNKTDLIVLTTQGDEGVTILYQEEPLEFRAERVLRFSPVFGTSWFELLDYDGDGDDDLLTVHGDNADKSYVQKPYHGFRIYLNNGMNEFQEAYFYPLHGATRVLGNDFDQDGDIDFCVLATFPDYDKEPILPFVYLQNDDPANFEFSTQVLSIPSAGRWLLLESGDIDKDGDEDIILSPFTYVFTPVPEYLNELWNQSGVDMLLLENKIIDNE